VNHILPIGLPGNSGASSQILRGSMESGERQFIEAVSDSKRGNLKKMINDVSFTATKKEEIVRRGARRYVANFWIDVMDLEDMLKKLTYEMLLY
jgi:hypothetical protein